MQSRSVGEQNQHEGTIAVNKENAETHSNKNVSTTFARRDIVTLDMKMPKTPQSAPIGFSSQLKKTLDDKKAELRGSKTGLFSDTSSTSSENDDSDDQRAKELLAKWGDKRYQSKVKNIQGLKKSKDKSKLSLKSKKYSCVEKNTEKLAKNSTVQDEIVISESDNGGKSVVDDSGPEKEAMSQGKSLPLSPDKSLLSSESITKIIQDDIKERETKKKNTPERLKKDEISPRPRGNEEIHKSNEKQEHFSSKTNDVVNPFARVKLLPKYNDESKKVAEKKNSLITEKESLKEDEIDDVIIRSSELGPNVSEVIDKEQINDVKNQNHSNSALLMRIKSLGSNIRSLKSGMQTGKAFVLPIEKEGNSSMQKQVTEDTISKSELTVPLDIEHSNQFDENETPMRIEKNIEKGTEDTTAEENAGEKDEEQGKVLYEGVKQQSGNVDGSSESRKDIISNEKKGSLFGKLNLNFNRLKGLIKDAFKEQNKEEGGRNDGGLDAGGRANEMKKNVLENDNLEDGKEGKKETHEDQMNVKGAVEREGNVNKGLCKEELATKKDETSVGASVKIKTGHCLEQTAQNEPYIGIRPKDDRFENDVAVQSAKEANTLSKNVLSAVSRSSNMNIARDPRLMAREMRQSEAAGRGGRTESNDPKKGTGNESPVGIEETRLNVQRQKTKDYNRLEVKRKSTESGESKKEEKGIEKEKKGSKAEKKVEHTRSKNSIDNVLTSQNLFEFTKVKSVNSIESVQQKRKLKRGFEESMDLKGKAKIDTSKKARYAFQKQPSKVEFTPAKDDVLGGILGRSDMMKTIDERGSKQEEQREESRNNLVNTIRANFILLHQVLFHGLTEIVFL